MTEPNPPRWPSSVKIFHPDQDGDEIMAAIEQTQDPFDVQHGCYTTAHHFSDQRWALLFAPGTYHTLNFEVGYYVQVAGLGTSPHDVRFTTGPFVPALDKHIHAPHGQSLDTFWRAAENFTTHGNLQWAVSQAAPLRRVHVQGDLHLHDGAAYASGGHLASARIDGRTWMGGQQQYLCRNVRFGTQGVDGGAWSLVFAGCSGNVASSCIDGGASRTITVPHVRMEKPFVALQNDGRRFDLCVPTATRKQASLSGAIWSDDELNKRDFEHVCVVAPCDDDIDGTIEAAMRCGKDVVFCPGICCLRRTIEVTRSNTVLLGLGLATLVNPSDGSACIHVKPHLQGVRIAGIMLEASPREAASRAYGDGALLEWGNAGVQDAGDANNPGGLFDVFCRVGGGASDRAAVSIDTMMRLHSGNVVGDNIWLWRADHSALAAGERANYPNISPVFWQNEATEARVRTGLEVNGDDVTIYGLAVEHANGHQTVWNGERGRVHFYQSELPYDADDEYAKQNFRGYFVSPNVKDHELHAPGVYSNFRNQEMKVTTAIECPDTPGVHVVNPFTVRLDNHGAIMSVINHRGPPALHQGTVVRPRPFDDKRQDVRTMG